MIDTLLHKKAVRVSSWRTPDQKWRLLVHDWGQLVTNLFLLPQSAGIWPASLPVPGQRAFSSVGSYCDNVVFPKIEEYEKQVTCRVLLKIENGEYISVSCSEQVPEPAQKVPPQRSFSLHFDCWSKKEGTAGELQTHVQDCQSRLQRLGPSSEGQATTFQYVICAHPNTLSILRFTFLLSIVTIFDLIFSVSVGCTN